MIPSLNIITDYLVVPWKLLEDRQHFFFLLHMPKLQEIHSCFFKKMTSTAVDWLRVSKYGKDISLAQLILGSIQLRY